MAGPKKSHLFFPGILLHTGIQHVSTMARRPLALPRGGYLCLHDFFLALLCCVGSATSAMAGDSPASLGGGKEEVSKIMSHGSVDAFSTLGRTGGAAHAAGTRDHPNGCTGANCLTRDVNSAMRMPHTTPSVEFLRERRAACSMVPLKPKDAL